MPIGVKLLNGDDKNQFIFSNNFLPLIKILNNEKKHGNC